MQSPAPTQDLEGDQHNKREASPVGPSHRNSRPQGASAKPILPPSQSSVLAQTSLLPDPLLPFNPPEDQLIWDSRTMNYFNQFHSLSTTSLCPTLQLNRCSAPPQYLLNAHHPLPPTSPEDQLVTDLHTIGYLISPTPIHDHPNQSIQTNLQYSLLPGSLPDHPDEAKRCTIVKILKREKPTPHSIHGRRQKNTSGVQPHHSSSTKNLPQRPMPRPFKIGVHIETPLF
jgi:hypothetical protein